MTRILVIDNYDSFVFNLVQYLCQLDVDVDVRRNDEVTVDEARAYDGILISPGPGTPESAGVCMDVVRECAGDVPILGVCLGHQVIAAVYGGVVDRAPELLHGKTSQVEHAGVGVLAGLPEPFTATRYHSLAVAPESVPRCPRGHRHHGERRDHGSVASRGRRRGSAVPPGVRAHRGWSRAAGQLAGGVR